MFFCKRNEAIVYIYKKTRSSKYSIVSLEKKKLAKETEKRKHELKRKRSQIQFEMEQKQKEIDNSMHILEMEQDLKKAVLVEQDKGGSCSIHSNLFLAEALEEKQREKSVTEWVNNIPQEEPHEIPKDDNKTKVQNFTDRGSYEIKMLCETLTNVLNPQKF
ncbi:hypothetical protein JTB14_001181 [Gonioctena quinquepunctata]|nr:hypothetical protein JTB14_001181 [Gonioctena quinquepunctata]